MGRDGFRGRDMVRGRTWVIHKVFWSTLVIHVIYNIIIYNRISHMYIEP